MKQRIETHAKREFEKNTSRKSLSIRKAQVSYDPPTNSRDKETSLGPVSRYEVVHELPRIGTIKSMAWILKILL